MIREAIGKESFRWVDDYLAHVRPHFDVRIDDELLIVLPNRAVKLNRTGLAVLRHVKGGGSIRELVDHIGDDEARLRDLYYFLCDFKALIAGHLGEGFGRRAVEIEPAGRRPFNVLPVLSEVALTYRCNLRCRFCYAGCNCRSSHKVTVSRDIPSPGGMASSSRPCLFPGTRARHGREDAAMPPGQEMSTDEVLRVFEILRHEAKVPSVSFTGGEPLLREDVVALAAGAVRAGLRVNLITNATQLSGTMLARRLADAGLSSAQVSLEGPSAAVHDGLTGRVGSFEQTLGGLALLQEAGIHVHTNTTVNAANCDHLPDLVALVARLGLRRMSMNLIIPAGTAADRSLQIPYRQIGPIVDRIHRAARAAGIEFLWYSPTPMCLYNPLAAGLGNKSCAACDGLVSVSPSGDVLPCSSFPEPVGNLLTQPFSEVWNSARAKFLRAKAYAPAQCGGCEDFTACAGACPLYWSAMGTDELNALGRNCHAPA